MKWTCFFFLILSIKLLAQVDSTYIQLMHRDGTVQVHLTCQDFQVRSELGNEDDILFRINNLSTGFYFKVGLAQLFVSIPIFDFDNRSYQAPNSFGTGFALNAYLRSIHLNYNFKYAQGYETLGQVQSDGLRTLSKYNYFFFNRLNSLYIFNYRKFSLDSALRFRNRQKRSAGSFLVGLPISYHFGNVEDTALSQFARFSIGPMLGYGQTLVMGPFAFSAIGKSGFDFRYTTDEELRHWSFRPSLNVILSCVYDIESHFIGLVYNYYPEFDYGADRKLEIINWKLRLYVGKRFH